MVLVDLINILFRLLYLLILARVIMSWVFPRGLDHPIAEIIHRLTSPVLDPLRRVMPSVGGLDLTPILALLLLGVVHQLVIQLLLTVLF